MAAVLKMASNVAALFKMATNMAALFKMATNRATFSPKQDPTEIVFLLLELHYFSQVRCARAHVRVCITSVSVYVCVCCITTIIVYLLMYMCVCYEC